MISRRKQDPEPRKRPQDSKDNPATWSVIIGTFICVMLFLGAAYTRQPMAGLVVGIVILIYVVVLSVPGHVNIVRILWGETIDEDNPEVNVRLIRLATVATAIVAIGTVVYDQVFDDEWGWFSWIAGLIGLGYLAFVLLKPDQKGESE